MDSGPWKGHKDITPLQQHASRDKSMCNFSAVHLAAIRWEGLCLSNDLSMAACGLLLLRM